jgi:uncharacterized ferritin-like protein (DUF455 family)
MADEALFVAGPARDERFVVVDRWAECTNFPSGHPMRDIEFIHRQMNEEVNGLECSAQALADFPEAEWELRMWLARQCADEARHGRMFRSLLEARGGRVGQFPVLNFQYRIINKAETLVGRLTIQNRSFEAGGIDAVSAGVDDAAAKQDSELATLFDAQLADEIVHVRFANEWIRRAIDSDRSTLLRMGTALVNAQKGFAQVMDAEATEGATYPADRQARLEAGFTDKEIDLAEELAAAKVSTSGAS